MRVAARLQDKCMKKIIPIFQFFIICGLSFISGAAPSYAQIQAVANGQTITVDAHGTCRKVTNSGGPTTMIPSRTAAEWNSFINSRPGHIGLAACGPVCGGVLHAGYCWYDSGWSGAYRNASCDATCSGRGGVNTAGTINYAGSGGNMSNCIALNTAMGYPVSGAVTFEHGCIQGCFVQKSPTKTYHYRCTAGTSTAYENAGSSSNRLYRACACNS